MRPKSDVAVLLTTFFLTVLVDLTVAVEVGMVLAAFLFMRRMAEVTNVSAITREFGEDADDRRDRGLRREGVAAGRGGVRDQRPVLLRRRGEVQGDDHPASGTPRVLVILMRNVPAMDSTGLARCVMWSDGSDGAGRE